MDSDSLRAALEATVLSSTGQAVGVDADGRVVGVTFYDRLRVAIQQTDEAAWPAAGGTACGPRPPPRAHCTGRRGRDVMSWALSDASMLAQLTGQPAQPQRTRPFSLIEKPQPTLGKRQRNPLSSLSRTQIPTWRLLPLP